ncbi:hypothetical protein AK830_g1426 [Neonectria ditissima]|uniref:BPL/LPL catalytic domain-containing protein n=1 Tax=Neonectria ditissima TaxID=78410 RepID=A0A0P7B600_9HYPO|nr:hypothetical protein AK830_g1426 [Neonectria ditissima]
MPPPLRAPTRIFSIPQPGAPVRLRGALRRIYSDARRWSSSGRGHPPLLTHEHLVDSGPGAFVPYDTAHAAQDDLRARLLAWKNLPDDQRPDPPRPHLLTFEATPTITLGRRQSALKPTQSSRLQAPLRVVLPRRPTPVPEASFAPDIRQTSRGGLTTYHGPGQLVFWPVVDMHSPLHARYSVLSYAAHLEATTRRLLADVFGLASYTTRDEPGVWVPAPAGQPERKIAALGVHHRRHVTSLGIALNVDIPVTGPEDVNPWARFVPCGLDGKRVTSVATELQQQLGENGADELLRLGMAGLAARWAMLFEEGLVDATKREVNGETDVSLRRVKKDVS